MIRKCMLSETKKQQRKQTATYSLLSFSFVMARRSISGRQSHSLIMIPGRRICSLFRSQTTLTSSYACKQERAVQAVSFPRKKERNSVQEGGNRVLDHLHKNGEKCLHTF